MGQGHAPLLIDEGTINQILSFVSGIESLAPRG
jgi:hypothetical protein